VNIQKQQPTRTCDRVRAAIERKGLTQKQAAAVLMISQTYLNDILTGKRAVSGYIAVRLQKHFGVNAQILLFQQATAEIAAAWDEIGREGEG
jgi:plasmid maintenance system antidote protein VapI